jgi:DtxR family Mn-dependent transcriptional regulator
MYNPFIWLLLLVILTALVIWLFRPARGIFWRWQQARKMTERVYREDALKHLHRCERHGRQPTVESLAGALQISADKAAEVMSELEAHDLIEFDGENFSLTPRGRDYALHIIRAHRLWERYLADETGYNMEVWHGQAEQAEHGLTPEGVEALAAELGYPTYDPHGDPIPTSAGELVSHGGQPLTAMKENQPVQIVHIEDEPEAVYAQLVAEGIQPGMEARLLEISPQRVRFWVNGDEHLLAPIVAANISVIPMPQMEGEGEEDGQRLTSLSLGQKGEVLYISKASHGNERRRFLDLGILPGTVIKAEMVSPSGDPTAYLIRDALIALRQEQADKIRIKIIEPDQANEKLLM